MRKIINIFKVFIIFSYTAILMTFAILLVFLTFGNSATLWIAKHIYAPSIAWLLGAKLDVKGVENIDFSKPHVFISNHQSYIDIMIMIIISECQMYFVAKDELRKTPFLGWYIKSVGMIFVKRGSSKAAHNSLMKAGELIRNGKSVVLFPEGTRSRDGAIGRFKKGAFHIALEAGVEIIPVAMSGGRIVMPYNILKSEPNTIKVRVGVPISLDGYNKGNLNDLVKIAEQKVKDLQSV